jgi:amino acid adenylation domain-containing protein
MTSVLPPAGTLHFLAARSAARDPDALAIDGPGGRVGYGELDRRVAALAAGLADRGVRPHDRVVIWCADPVAAIVAMQAVLRLGAAYVPVADDSPVTRTLQVAGDCAAAVVCTTADRIPLIDGAGATVVAVDAVAESRTGRAFTGSPPVNPDDTAYLLYTSGSTGTPKGVVISHRNARAFVDWAAAEFALRPGDRLAGHAALTFDLSVFDVYGAFAAGACVVPVPTALKYDAPRLAGFLSTERISVWYSVPSALMLLMRFGDLTATPPPTALRLILFAGEPFPIQSVKRLARWAGRPLYNLYGPTETNVCTFHRVTEADLAGGEPLPIGRACCGARLEVVPRPGDADGTGELHVEGPTVFQGYWGSPRRPGPYVTGDLVRESPDGSLSYLGRVDDMLKVRGHRVEPAEVEAAANAYPGVAASAAVALGSGLDGQLVLVVEPAEAEAVRTLALRRHLVGRLAGYLLPDRVLVVPGLPRNTRGKVDRDEVRSLVRRAER